MFSLVKSTILIFVVFLLLRNISMFINHNKTNSNIIGNLIESKECDSNEIILTNYILSIILIILSQFINDINIRYGIMYGGLINLFYTTYINWTEISNSNRIILLISCLLFFTYKDILFFVGVMDDKGYEENYDDLLNNIKGMIFKGEMKGALNFMKNNAAEILKNKIN